MLYINTNALEGNAYKGTAFCTALYTVHLPGASLPLVEAALTVF